MRNSDGEENKRVYNFVIEGISSRMIQYEQAFAATPPSAFGSRDGGVLVAFALCQTTVQRQSAVGEDRAFVKLLTWTADSEIIESNHLYSRLDDKLGVDGLCSCPTALAFDFEDNTRHRSR